MWIHSILWHLTLTDLIFASLTSTLPFSITTSKLSELLVVYKLVVTKKLKVWDLVNSSRKPPGIDKEKLTKKEKKELDT